jgi:hypothetical protein
MQTIFCDYCRRSFRRKKSQIEKAKKHFCSNQCRYLVRKKGNIFNCFICGKRTYKSLKYIKLSKSKKFFCSRPCSTQYLNLRQREEKHPNWKGGRSSYKEILPRYVPKSQCFFCNASDQRILIVHHADKNRDNNFPDNLTWLCCNCHFLVHHDKKITILFQEKFKRYVKNKYKM